MLAYVFRAHALAPAVRARIELTRQRVAGPEGMSVVCGGASMEPVIARGARVTVRAGRPARGRVAAFVTAGGELELHRLIARGPIGWWAHLGDNQAAPIVGLVHESQIVGIADVASRRPGVGARARAVVRLTRAALRVTRDRVGVRRQPR
jgi:hypothetical protein